MMVIVAALLIAAALCLVLAIPGTSEEQDEEVIGTSTQHGWVQKKGPSAVNKASHNIHRY